MNNSHDIHIKHTIIARSGVTITMRTARPDDAPALYEMTRRLSPSSLYYRYLAQHSPGFDEIEALCRMPLQQGGLLIATAPEKEEAIVGAAEYRIDHDAQVPSAELGIVVEDCYQGQGIGKALFRTLADNASRRGLHSLHAVLDASNHTCLRMLRGSGYEARSIYADGLLEVRVTLKQPSRIARLDHRVTSTGTFRTVSL